MESFAEATGMPSWALLPLILVAVVQIGIEIYALVVLFKTPDERLQFGKKWPWIIIILFVNLVGAIVFLVAGRKPAAAVDPLAQGALAAQAPAAERAARAADVLYGSPGDDER